MQTAVFEILLGEGNVMHMRPQVEFIEYIRDFQRQNPGVEVFAGPADNKTKTVMSSEAFDELRLEYNASSSMRMIIQFSRGHLSFLVMLHGSVGQNIEPLIERTRSEIQIMANDWPTKYQRF